MVILIRQGQRLRLLVCSVLMVKTCGLVEKQYVSTFIYMYIRSRVNKRILTRSPII